MISEIRLFSSLGLEPHGIGVKALMCGLFGLGFRLGLEISVLSQINLNHITGETTNQISGVKTRHADGQNYKLQHIL